MKTIQNQRAKSKDLRPKTQDQNLRSSVVRLRRQLNHESGTPGVIGLRPDTSAVLHDYPLNNCEAQTRAAAAGGEVRLKQPCEIRGPNSMPIIRNFYN